MAEGPGGSSGAEASLVTKLHTKTSDTLCVCTTKDDRLLLTGHDASTWKIWSANDWSLLHSIQTSVLGGAVNSVCSSPSNEHQFAVSVEESVLLYDHRELAKPVHTFHFNQDEVNQIDIHPKGNFLCSCDDAGEIKVVDIENGKLFKTLFNQHDNICSTVKFHPCKPWEVVSGGLDCNLVRWDFSRGRPLCTVSVIDEEQRKQCGTYTVNPPMVHSLDVVGRNSSVVCGLGNGSVAVYGLQGKSLVPKCSISLHSASVAHVCCSQMTWGGTEGKPLVISGGNDEKIVVSELREEQGQEQPSGHGAARRGKRQVFLKTQLKVLLQIDHRSKVNWIASLDAQEDRLCRIYVADQTQCVSVYEVKGR